MKVRQDRQVKRRRIPFCLIAVLAVIALLFVENDRNVLENTKKKNSSNNEVETNSVISESSEINALKDQYAPIVNKRSLISSQVVSRDVDFVTTIVEDIKKDYLSTHNSGYYEFITNNFNLRAKYTQHGVTMVAANRPFESSEWTWNYKLRSMVQGENEFYVSRHYPKTDGKDENKVSFDYGPVKEVYENKENSVEQVFVIDAPIGEGDIRLVGDVSTELELVDAQSDEITFGRNGKTLFTYKDLYVYDSKNNEIPAEMSWDNGSIVLAVHTEGLAPAYPIYVDPTVQSVSQSYSTEVTSSDLQAFQFMGLSTSVVDVNGDGYTDLVVGAPSYDGANADEGKVYLYLGSSSGISTSSSWSINGASSAEFLGMSVSGAGDVNGDGFEDVLIGLPGYKITSDNNNNGRAVLFYGSASGLSSEADWTVTGTVNNEWLGQEVASAGDINNDGYFDVAVSAPGNGGRVHIFHGSSSGVSVSATVMLSGDDQNAAQLGYSVSAGNFNGDSYYDVVVSAFSFTGSFSREGAVYVYYGSALGVTDSYDEKYLGGQANSGFGISVASAGDVNGDGYDEMIVGALKYDTAVTDGGKVFAYYGSSAGLSSSADWISVGPEQASAFFGKSVSTAGDINGDGYDDILIGAYAYDTANTNAGAAYIYLGSSSGLASVFDKLLNGPDQGSAFYGWEVIGNCDFNGDGLPDIAVTAPLYSTDTSSFTGAVYIHHGVQQDTKDIVGDRVEEKKQQKDAAKQDKKAFKDDKGQWKAQKQ